eukprot:gene11481-biopygen8132
MPQPAPLLGTGRPAQRGPGGVEAQGGSGSALGGAGSYLLLYAVMSASVHSLQFLGAHSPGLPQAHAVFQFKDQEASTPICDRGVSFQT